jgi:glucose dehydrogenase
LQAEVWRTCGVGVLLFLAVPAIGWLQQSAILIVTTIVAVIAVGVATWYFSSRRTRVA